MVNPRWILAAIVLTAASCSFLDVEPETEISRNEAFASVETAEQVLVGIYQLLGGTSNDNYYRTLVPLYPEAKGNLKPTPRGFNSGNTSFARYAQLFNCTVTPNYDNSNFDDMYENAYGILYQVNDFIVGVGQIPGLGEEQRATFLAEAHFIRALVHFNLVNQFAHPPGFTVDDGHLGVVLALEVADLLERRPRNTVAEVYDAILADLTVALENSSPSAPRPSSRPIWVTRPAVLALLARVHAYRRDWSATAEFATLALAETGSDPATVILEAEVQFVLDEGDENAIGLGAEIGVGREEPRVFVSEDLFALFAPDDLRRELYPFDPEADGRLTRKYPFVPARINNPPILRVAELYLLLAEARAELGNPAEARAALQPILAAARPSFTLPELEGEELLTFIRRERRRELALEGHHLFDQNRWQLPIPRSDCAFGVETCDIPYPDPRRILPIPLGAIIRNRQLVQNEGY